MKKRNIIREWIREMLFLMAFGLVKQRKKSNSNENPAWDMVHTGATAPKRRSRNIEQRRDNRWKGVYDVIKHRLLEGFCRACGLNKRELAQLKPEDVYRSNRGNVIVHVRPRKDIKERFVWAINDVPLELAEQAAARGEKRIFPNVPKCASWNQWRGAYARELYNRYERPVMSLPK